jgi:hypothetical protein
MFWAVLQGNKRTSFLLLDRDLESIRGGITTRVIIEVYRIFFLMIVRPGDIFIQDNIFVYTVYIVRAVL